MKPHDLLVALKRIANPDVPWSYPKPASGTGVSLSETYATANRLIAMQIIHGDCRTANRPTCNLSIPAPWSPLCFSGGARRSHSRGAVTAYRAESEDRLITAPYFLATKLVAFESRAKGDYWGSRDIEDVVTVIDGRPRLVKEVLAADAELRRFLADTLSARLHDPDFHPALPGYLAPDAASQGRVPLVVSRRKTLIEAASRGRG